MIDKDFLINAAKESLAMPVPVPKKRYKEPEAEQAKPQAETRTINRTKLESDLYELVYAAGGQAPGYRRQLNKILDQYL